MSVKRALLICACALAVGSVGDAVIVGTTAAGSPAPAAAPLAQPAVTVAEPATMLDAAPEQPRATLHLPTTLHLIDQNTQTTRLSGGKLVIIATLSRKTGRQIGSAVYSCNPDGLGGYKCDSAFALAGGLIIARETVSKSGALNGQVTDGTGDYEGAKGNVKATTRPDGRANLTISYSVG